MEPETTVALDRSPYADLRTAIEAVGHHRDRNMGGRVTKTVDRCQDDGALEDVPRSETLPAKTRC
jgi:hypothetical protein